VQQEPRITLARDGYPMIVGTLVVAGLLCAAAALSPGRLATALGIAAGVVFVAALFLVNFFRDPRREVPREPGLIVSPADGRVIAVEAAEAKPRFVSAPAAKISIFMSPLNVHVNRAPVDGEVVAVHYHPGEYFAAFSDKASLDNEQNAIVMRSSEGREIAFVQIAGFLARRIVCRVEPGQHCARGERVGMIKLGSRVDVYIPGEVALRVKPGQNVTAGETVLGVLS
jgi:phosphatidylserine decarboxylase